MIEFITEAEYERRFDLWAKTNQPAQDAVISNMQGLIQTSSNMLAVLVIGQHRPMETLRAMRKNAFWNAQRAAFNKQFVAGPTGPDRNAIPFGGWNEKGTTVKQ